ncbi:signal transducer and activator of transcription 5A-like [Anopheles cruzii]|uniref:signal transducer and activator of transcription 5A-like n=1 Tax=Anopheles cruzii TaxID=68878 RepID=UPI0022EC63E6|nr:signal transducer and activator of transcription 5A-like [Anopheles cruzii]
MSLWARINQLPSRILEEVRSMYTDDFPIEVRHYLADWIEEHLLIRPVPIDQPGVCEDFVTKLINEVEKTAFDLPGNITAKTRLNEAAFNFRVLRSVNPSKLFFNIICCLEREQEYAALPAGCRLCVGNPELHKVCAAIKELEDMARQIENDNSNFMKKLGLLPSDKHALQYVHTNPQELAIPAIHGYFNVVEIQHVTNEQTQSCTRMELALVDGFRNMIKSTGDVQAKVLNEYLVQWKTNKLLHPNACPNTECDLRVIQGWCESLAEIMLTTKNQIELALMNVANRRMVYNVSEMLSQALNDVKGLLKTLITQTFIIEKQPPQVIATRTSFAASACLLVGNVLNIRTVNPLVKVSIISGTQLQRALQSDQPPEQSCGELVRNIEQFQYNVATKKFSFGLVLSPSS